MSIRDEVEKVLGALGQIERVDWPELLEEHEGLQDVRWRALYSYRVGEEIWAVDIFRGNWPPRSSVIQMNQARQILPSLRPTFFVPEDEDHEIILELCLDHHVEIITRLGGSYCFLPLGQVPVAAPQPEVIGCRLPPLLVERIAQVGTLDSHFRDSLREFAECYLNKISQPGWNDEAEQQLLSDHLSYLLSVDERFSAPYESLETLRYVESHYSPESRRDHYFHAFHTFLLGCRVMDQCGPNFATPIAELMGVPQLSCVYIWLLTALFHDVGYLQESPQLERLAYGITMPMTAPEDGTDGEFYVQQRLHLWDRVEYRWARTQLVSLCEYLAQEHPNPPWHPDSQVPDSLSERPFDRALHQAYVSGSHGVASALRFLSDFHRLLRGEEDSQKRLFWSWHIYIAAVSMPFHDRGFRLALSAIDVHKLSTLRFPFASLLAFVDSIQDDRRHLHGESLGPDILQDILVEGNKVRPVVDWDNLAQEQVRQIMLKRDDIADLSRFLLADGLEFVYPDELVGSFGVSAAQ